MIYVPEWETLAETIERLTGLGYAESAARVDLSRAIGDGKIRLRVTVAGDDDYCGAALVNKSVCAPMRLSPADFDWPNSRPLQAWGCGPYPGHLDWQARPIELVEVSTLDVRSVLAVDPPAHIPVRSRKVSPAQVTRLFDERRRNHKGPPPTRDEDMAFLESIGASRRLARKLRAAHENNTVGRPKTARATDVE
jgi:hypothetical protein